MGNFSSLQVSILVDLFCKTVCVDYEKSQVGYTCY